MTLIEFSQRTGFTPDEQYYHEVIEKEYNRSKLDKDQWCKEWVKNGGIEQAYYDIQKQLQFKHNALENFKAQLKTTVEQLKELTDKYEAQSDELNKSQEDIKKIKEEYDMFKFKVSKFFISRGTSLLSDFLTFKAYE